MNSPPQNCLEYLPVGLRGGCLVCGPLFSGGKAAAAVTIHATEKTRQNVWKHSQRLFRPHAQHHLLADERVFDTQKRWVFFKKLRSIIKNSLQWNKDFDSNQILLMLLSVRLSTGANIIQIINHLFSWTQKVCFHFEFYLLGWKMAFLAVQNQTFLIFRYLFYSFFKLIIGIFNIYFIVVTWSRFCTVKGIKWDI